MTADPRNVPLIERRADARVLEGKIRDHKRGCLDCARTRGQCSAAAVMRKELKAMREELRTWFAPGPDQATLWEDSDALPRV
jgi:hypothetical protein